MKSTIWQRLLLSVWLVLGIMVARAQYNIVALSVSPIYLKGQLWNLSLSNTGIPVQGRIQLDMKDLQTHQSVLSAATGIFRLPTGASVIQMQSLEPIVYSYNSPVVVDRSPNGPLPVGQYQVCYQLLLSYGENQGAVAEDCEEIAVEPLSPPLLTSPENDSTLATMQPNFTWLPPTPLNMFSNLTYDVIISEVNDGQSVTDAIDKNLPIQQAQGLQQPFLTYPLQGPQLEDGKTYAWQIVARDNMQYAAKSEVWSFRTPAIRNLTSSGNFTYILMDEQAGSIGSSDSSALYVKYVSFSSAYRTPVQVKDQRGNVLLNAQVLIRQGDNYLDIPLNGSFQRKHNYILVFQDKTGKQLSQPFTVK